jgi:hypothetical protein
LNRCQAGINKVLYLKLQGFTVFFPIVLVLNVGFNMVVVKRLPSEYGVKPGRYVSKALSQFFSIAYHGF